jgi:hypothetical protein
VYPTAIAVDEIPELNSFLVPRWNDNGNRQISPGAVSPALPLAPRLKPKSPEKRRVRAEKNRRKSEAKNSQRKHRGQYTASTPWRQPAYNTTIREKSS